ncbi:MAG: hypothetical protein RIR79_915 [Pseudomonadota bacterium]
MADVVVGRFHADLEFGIARNAELFTCAGFHPFGCAIQQVVAATGNAFHDFRCARVEGEGGGQNHADRFFCAIGEGDAVAHAFAVKVHIGLGGDGYAVDVGSCHSVGIRG